MSLSRGDLVSVVIVGDREVAAEFDRMAFASRVEVRAATRHYGQLLRTRVMAKASGRPGPNVQTGDYRRSIALQVDESSGTVTASVGSNAAQARRLEFGFHGADSLGRVYNQPPFPHFGPAFDEIQLEFAAALARVAGGGSFR